MISSIIAAATALAAVILAPLITVRVSHNQMLGPMRQAWINNLRDTVAEFSARIRLGYDATWTSTRDESVRHQQATDRVMHVQTTYQLLAKIELLINAREAEHQELVRLARSAFDAYEERGKPVATVLRALVEHTQAVLKTEWDVVKGIKKK